MKVRLFFSTGMAGGRHEDIFDIPEDEMEGMNEEEREDHLNGYATDFMSNHIDYGFEVLDG